MQLLVAVIALLAAEASEASACSPAQQTRRCVSCIDNSTCTACAPGYGVAAGGECIAACLLPGYRKPSNPPPGVYHGIEWPLECHDDEGAEHHFFAIGDWGGDRPGHPADNIHGRRQKVGGIDDRAQSNVARVMNDRAKEMKPKFVLSAGDNFYWGGVANTCGTAARWPRGACMNYDFWSKFENIYKGNGMKNVPWFSVLGNHDYGGRGFRTGWDTQIYRTYCPHSRWRMPGMYWKQKVQFRDFSVDILLLDTNTNDRISDKNHMICQGMGGCKVPNATMNDQHHCREVLQQFWRDGVTWALGELERSTADWQIAVTHFPPGTNRHDWQKLAQKGLDFVVSGHVHNQLLFKEKGGLPPFVITGGGGGITSEQKPSTAGHDHQYGFVDFTISREKLKVEMISHGGLQHEHYIVMDSETFTPRPKQETDEHELLV